MLNDFEESSAEVDGIIHGLPSGFFSLEETNSCTQVDDKYNDVVVSKVL